MSIPSRKSFALAVESFLKLIPPAGFRATASNTFVPASTWPEDGDRNNYVNLDAAVEAFIAANNREALVPGSERAALYGALAGVGSDWSPGIVDDTSALTGAGADWGVTTPAPAYSYFADMSAAVDEAIEEDRVAERAAIWSAVAKTEADYDTAFVKCDGREG